MKNIHLTDEEIQQYVLDAHTCSEVLLKHIKHCEHCQQQALHYQLLFEGIEAQEKVVFNFDLTSLVMEQLPQTKPAYDKQLIYALAATIVTMIGATGFVFGNSLISLFAYVQPILVGLVIITAIGLAVFLGIDMYQKYKAQIKTLSLY